MNILLPYGRESISLELDKKNVSGILISRLERYDPEKTPQELVEDAIPRRCPSQRKLPEAVKLP